MSRQKLAIRAIRRNQKGKTARKAEIAALEASAAHEAEMEKGRQAFRRGAPFWAVRGPMALGWVAEEMEQRP